MLSTSAPHLPVASIVDPIYLNELSWCISFMMHFGILVAFCLHVQNSHAIADLVCLYYNASASVPCLLVASPKVFVL